MGALSEYGTLAGGQHKTLQLPTDLGSIGKWALYALAAYLALRLIATLARGASRR